MGPTADLVEMHRRMLLIRGFEQRVAALYRDGEVPGFVHLSIGQEAAAVGACWPLRPADVITSTHRGHGHCLAKGLDPLGMFAELMAKDQGTNRGRGGSMHIADPKLGIFGANGIVAAGLPIAVGAATAAQLRADGSVAVAFFGDGAPAQGAFHEALNLAAVWRLPVVFFCENNGYAEFSPVATQHAASLERRAAGYGIRYVAVDGNDVVATAAAMEDVVLAARAGEGPAVVEATTYRWHGHYEGDPERYRSPEEVREWEARDPLLAHERRLRDAGVGDDEIKALEAAVAAELDGAVEAARRLAAPAPATLHDFVVRARPARPEPPAAARGRAGVPHHGRRPGRAGGRAGGRRAGVRGRHRRRRGRQRLRPHPRPRRPVRRPGARHPDLRDRDHGRRRGGGHGRHAPRGRAHVPRLPRGLLRPAAQPGGQAAVHDRRRRAQMALTVRTQFGAGRSSGSQHSQSLEALLAHIPGLTVVMPSTPADTYGLLRAAIQDPNPVVFIENRLLYGMKGPQPPADHVVPIGASAVVRPGTDATVVSVSRMVHEALAAAEALAAEGISVEVIDLRTVAPLDMAPILDSVHRTSRLLVAHEAAVPFGIGAEIAATVAREAFWDLDAPDRAGRRRGHAAALRARAGAGLAPRPRRHRRRHPAPGWSAC